MGGDKREGEIDLVISNFTLSLTLSHKGREDLKVHSPLVFPPLTGGIKGG